MSDSIHCIQSLKVVEGSRYPSVCLFGCCVAEVKESEWKESVVSPMLEAAQDLWGSINICS